MEKISFKDLNLSVLGLYHMTWGLYIIDSPLIWAGEGGGVSIYNPQNQAWLEVCVTPESTFFYFILLY